MKGVKRRYAIAKWEEPKLWYTDKCCQDAALVKKTFPKTVRKGDLYHYINRIIHAVKDPRSAPSLQFTVEVGDCFRIKEEGCETVVYTAAEIIRRLTTLQIHWDPSVRHDTPLTPVVRAAIERVCEHVRKGCVTDEEDIAKYPRSVLMMGGQRKQVRGTSQLETHHKHLKSVLNGRTHSLESKRFDSLQV